MIYRVRHATRYVYGGTVDLAAHMLHLRPRPLPGRQHVLETAIAARPPAARRREAPTISAIP